MTTAGGFLDAAKATAIFAGLALGVYALFQSKKILAAVNPASKDNLAYGAANTIAEVVSGEQDVTVGTFLGDIADWLKGNSDIDTIDRREAAKGKAQ